MSLHYQDQTVRLLWWKAFTDAAVQKCLQYYSFSGWWLQNWSQVSSRQPVGTLSLFMSCLGVCLVFSLICICSCSAYALRRSLFQQREQELSRGVSALMEKKNTSVHILNTNIEVFFVCFLMLCICRKREHLHPDGIFKSSVFMCKLLQRVATGALGLLVISWVLQMCRVRKKSSKSLQWARPWI